MSLRESITNVLNSREEQNKKLISVNLDAALLARVDRVAAGFSRINSTRNFSRNAVIELAVQDYVDEAERVIEEYGRNMDSVSEEGADFDYDLAIFPAHNDGFVKAFLGEDKWYSVRIKENKIPKIKYVACYRAAPVSGITHFAKVKEIRPYLDTEKKEILFDGPAIELPEAVKLGATNANAMRSPRYTTLEKLTNAKRVEDLF